MSFHDPGRLVRTNGGTIVHREDCLVPMSDGTWGNRPVPWLWASSRDPEQVLEAIRYFGHTVCRVCEPFLLEGEEHD